MCHVTTGDTPKLAYITKGNTRATYNVLVSPELYHALRVQGVRATRILHTIYTHTNTSGRESDARILHRIIYTRLPSPLHLINPKPKTQNPITTSCRTT